MVLSFNYRCIAVAAIAIYLSFLYKFYNEMFRPLPRPKINLKQYWGPGLAKHYKEDTSISSFKLSYSDNVMKELHSKLSEIIEFPEPFENIGFQYGFNTIMLKLVVDYWRDDYLPRWSERQNYLNKYDQYTTNIQGLRIHFIHKKLTDSSKRNKIVYPILLLHGWPSSVIEYYDIITKLTTANKKNHYIFEVIAPSLPGHAWSQGSAKVGFGQLQMSIVLRNLMIRLGYKKFFIHGGGWGAVVGRDIATMFPENVIGFHTNSCHVTSTLSILKLIFAATFQELFFSEDELGFYLPLKNKLTLLIQECGYFYYQATKPDTIGSALTANPIGLAAYILEKFSIWTNEDNIISFDGALNKDIKLDILLDNVMIYYLTNSILTSQRIYAEAWASEAITTRVPVLPPTGCVHFKKDLFHNFNWQLNEKYSNIIHSKYYQKGGHYAAIQVPDILYKDFIMFVEKVLGNNTIA